MTSNEFGLSPDWKPVARFCDISPTLDGEREFLEAIPKFRLAQESNSVLETGFLMPDFRCVIVGSIVDIDIVPPDASPKWQQDISQSMIVVKPAPSAQTTPQ